MKNSIGEIKNSEQGLINQHTFSYLWAFLKHSVNQNIVFYQFTVRIIIAILVSVILILYPNRLLTRGSQLQAVIAFTQKLKIKACTVNLHV